MIIKVCGMREARNISQLAELGIDYMGFIFHKPSKRFFGYPDKDFLAFLPNSIKKTGVFVNEDAEEIVDKVIRYNLDAVQLHGEETPEFCMQLQTLASLRSGCKIIIIKAFGVFKGFEFNHLQAFCPNVDFFLFDTKTSGHGGSGISFDWTILGDYNLETPYFLSGGLSPENISEVNFKDDRLYGLDLNSKFETEPGIKDIEKLRSLIQLIKKQPSGAI